MRTHKGCAWRSLTAACLGMLAVAAAAQSWTFDGNAEGWSVGNFVGGSSWATSVAWPVEKPVLQWSGSGGSSGGYIFATDPDSNTFAFVAPVINGGNYSAYAGGTLSFSLECLDITASNTWGNDNVVVFRGGAGNRVIAASIGNLPGNTWTDYSLNLSAANFHYDGKSGGLVSDADFTSVLSNVTAMYISGEFVGSPPWETTGLDSVKLTAVPEPSTYAAMLGGAALVLVAVRRYRRR